MPPFGSRTPSQKWHFAPNLAKHLQTQNGTSKHLQYLHGALVHKMQAERQVCTIQECVCVCVLFILVLHLSQRRSQDVGLLPTRSKHRCWRLSIVIDTKFHSVTAGLLDQVPEIRFNHRCNGNIEKGRKVSERQPENW